MIGKIPRKAILASRHLLDFIYIAQYKTHDDDTLSYLEEALKGFHANKDIFIEFGCRTHFNIPKLHSLTHYVDSIKYFGTTDNYNTETFERLHIEFVKKPWRATNKKDEFPQMIDWLTRQEKLQMFDNYITLMGKAYTKTPKPHLAISLAKHPAAIKSIHSIVTDHRATNFIYHLQDYLNSLQDYSVRRPRSAVPNLGIPFDTLNVWYQFKMVHEDDSTQEKDQVKANPPGPNLAHGRFDTVVVLLDRVN